MILVTLGTQDKSFKRLLREIDRLLDEKIIKDEVIVQAGYTKYESNNMKIFDYVEEDELLKYIKKSDYVISHAGVGSILNIIGNNKKAIVVPRLAKYKEHTNNHQLEIAREFSEKGYILYAKELEDLEKLIKNIDTFKPKKLEHNKELIKTIEEFIDNI